VFNSIGKYGQRETDAASSQLEVRVKKEKTLIKKKGGKKKKKTKPKAPTQNRNRRLVCSAK